MKNDNYKWFFHNLKEFPKDRQVTIVKLQLTNQPNDVWLPFLKSQGFFDWSHFIIGFLTPVKGEKLSQYKKNLLNDETLQKGRT